MFFWQKKHTEALVELQARDSYTVDRLLTRMKRLEKRLGLTYNEGEKNKAHYKVASPKVGRPKGTKTHKHGA